MNKQQLAQKIWASANQMRSKIEASEYKDFILGFIFYKYLSDKEIEFLKKQEYSDDDLKSVNEEDNESRKWVQDNIGYFISYDNLFSTWLKMGKDFNVANVRDALSAFSRLVSPTHKRVFDKIFDTLQTGLSKLGDTSGTQTKAINGLLTLIKDIPMDGKQGYDVLGYIYEYLISMFAENAGKKAGEFYTPHEVSLLISEIIAGYLRNKNEINIYDPTSGSGSLLINIGKCVTKYISDPDNIKYYAQEIKENTYNLTRMNLVMRGIKPDNIVTRNADTLEDDWPYFDDNDPINSYNPLYVDAVVSNPPYSQTWDPNGKENDLRYKFGLAPKSKADYAFLLHDLYHLKPDGIMAIILPHGVLFRGGEEGIIRKNLIEYNHIDAIIGLPANIFFGTGIPTIIMILKQKRVNTDILIIDASKGFIKEGKNNKLRASDIKRISDVYAKRENVPLFSRSVSRDEIRKNDYNLNIPRYIDSTDNTEHWDIYASMFGGIPSDEIDTLKEYWKIFPSLRDSIFIKSNPNYEALSKKDIANTIYENHDVSCFMKDFIETFKTLPSFLKAQLVDSATNLDIARAESMLCDNIFERLNNIPLIDKYAAYQLFDNHWKNILVDLEIIQTEGFSSTKKVDPNMVIKKSAGTEQEVQDGWIGHVLPFNLVQENLLKNDIDAITKLESQLSLIPNEYSEIIENISEDDKESFKECFNEEGDSFITKEVSKMIKELKKDKTIESDDMYNVFIRVEKLSKQEKDLKKKITKLKTELNLQTKNLIESLNDDQVKNLLELKWIKPFINELNTLPDSIIKTLIEKIQNLENKYATTFFEIENEIKETEKQLAKMIEDLDGNEYDLKGLSEFKSLLLGE